MSPALPVLNLLTLHRDERRHTFWADSVPPIHFAEEIESWLCMDPGDIYALSRIPFTRAGTSDVLLAYDQLNARHGRAFPNLVFACQYIPLCFDGEEHRRVRRQLADFLAVSTKLVKPRLGEIVENAVGPLQVGGDIDFMGDVLDPLVSRFMVEVTGVDLPDPTIAFGLLSTFDRMIGLRKRQELEHRILRIREAIRVKIGPNGTEDDEGLRLAALILGQDTLRGTLGESLYQLIRSSPGRGFSSLDYPPTPNETGVPLVERIVTEAFEYNGLKFVRGDRIRLAMQGLVYSKVEADHARMFGIGSHACLGRRLSLDLWEALTHFLKRLPSVPEILDYKVRTDDYTFIVPSRLLIRVHV